MFVDNENILKNTLSIQIIGFGSQAKVWAMNLRDSGQNVQIWLRRESCSIAKAKALNFEVVIYDDNSTSRNSLDAKNSIDYKEALDCVLLIPDDQHLSFFEKYAHLFPVKSRFIFAHGYSVAYKKLQQTFIQFEFQYLLLAPKAIASELRFNYETRDKLVAVFGMLKEADTLENRKFLKTLAKHIGINIGPLETSFEEETVCDLFSEQAILCSLIPYGILHAYNTLIKNGRKREIAFIECWHEVKLIANALVNLGPIEFFNLISPNALVGSDLAQQQFFDQEFDQKLNNLLQNIENQQFRCIMDTCDINQVREKIINKWKEEDLSKMYQEFKNEYKLYK